MQTTIHLGQVQPTALSIMETAAKNIKLWWQAKSDSFSLLAGEEFTHGQVVLANTCFLLGLVAIMGAVAILNHLFGIGGAL